MTFRSLVLAAACASTLLLVSLWAAMQEPAADQTLPEPVARWHFAKKTLPGNRVAATGKARLEARLLGPKQRLAQQLADFWELQGNSGAIVRDHFGPSESFLPRRAISLTAWVRVDAPTRYGGIVGVLQDNGGYEKGWVLGYGPKHFYFGLATQGADDGDGKMTYLASKAAYDVGRWYHVAATYDGQVMRLYVNGQLDTISHDQSGAILYANDAPLVIGRYKDRDEDFPLHGALQTVGIYDQALTKNQVAALWHQHRALAQLPPVIQRRFVIAPYLQFPTETSVTIRWETPEPGTSVVDFGRTAQLNHRRTSDQPTRYHEVELTGLKPQTSYFYRVSTRSGMNQTWLSDILTFQTAVEKPSAFSFVVIGDTQHNPKVTGRIARLAWERRPNLILHVGDIVDDGHQKRQWVEEYFRPSTPLLGRVAVFPTLGNHERNADWYYRYFSLPAPEYYYQYQYGNTAFFVIDSNKPLHPKSEQYRWLDRALAQSNATWKIAYHHHPAYSSDENDYGDTYKGSSTYGDLNVRHLVQLYEKYGVDVVFNGHIHLYERTWPIRNGRVDQERGVVYVTTGGSGGGLEDFAPTPTWFKAECRVVHHFCYVTVHDRTFNLKAFDQEGRLFDFFTLHARQNGLARDDGPIQRR